jgi:hypothetical protein
MKTTFFLAILLTQLISHVASAGKSYNYLITNITTSNHFFSSSHGETEPVTIEDDTSFFLTIHGNDGKRTHPIYIDAFSTSDSHASSGKMSNWKDTFSITTTDEGVGTLEKVEVSVKSGSSLVFVIESLTVNGEIALFDQPFGAMVSSEESASAYFVSATAADPTKSSTYNCKGIGLYFVLTLLAICLIFAVSFLMKHLYYCCFQAPRTDRGFSALDLERDGNGYDMKEVEEHTDSDVDVTDVDDE